MIQLTTSIKKIAALKKKVKVIQGGSSASKTFAILILLIDKACRTPLLEISVISESVPHLKKGALKDFLKIMKLTNRFVQDRYNISDRKYTFHNGSYIEFFSPESVIGARRNLLFINEANNIKFNDFHDMKIRTSHEIFIDFNPVNEFWVHKELIGLKNVDFIKLNYLDNEALPINVIEDFEQAKLKAAREKASGIEGYWSNWCRVYIDGELGALQGCVFNNWEVIRDIPIEAKILRHGLDFGFNPDPMACTTIFEYNGKILVRENFYKTNMNLAELIQQCKLLEDVEFRCDSSNPMLIAELRRASIRALPCVKGQNSIEFGLNKLQNIELLIPEQSLNLIKELRGYVINEANGKPIGQDHLIDSLRYAYVVESKAKVKAKSY